MSSVQLSENTSSSSGNPLPPDQYSSEPPSGGSPLRKIVVLVILLVVAAAVWRIAANRRSEEAQANKAKSAAMADRPVPVAAAPVEQKTMPVYLTGLGSVTPYYSVTIKSRVDGQLMHVNFREGQEVQVGALLAEIDPRPYQAVLEQAQGQLARDQAQLANYQAEYHRYESLYNAGVVSKETLDAQRSNFGQFEGTIKADQAAIDSARVNLAYCRITSPIRGRIGLRLVDPGNIVHATDTTGLLVINQLHPITVIFTLPEDQLPQVIQLLRAGHSLNVDAYDRSDTTLLSKGKLLTMDNQIDQTTGTAKLKAVFANEEETLFPNQFVNIHLILQQRPNAIVIPAAALQHGNQGDFVYVVQPDKTVAIRPIHVDLTEGSSLLVGSGLKAGELVVTDGQEKLRPGSKVVVHTAASTTQAGSTTRILKTSSDTSANARRRL
ncbi:MAG: MdtA/MuxA family multidrug efflux RND transporter periplasmic adaptor subunit [Acidobacteriaceae bacterium]